RRLRLCACDRKIAIDLFKIRCTGFDVTLLRRFCGRRRTISGVAVLAMRRSLLSAGLPLIEQYSGLAEACG
ncbi:MAG: hypothetical protein AAFX02_01275, partial [Pseudomonadota bacterium]